LFKHNAPSINMTLVGFGQAGTRMVDKFAALKTKDGKPVYNTLALNSNDGDLKELKHVPVENQVSLKLGGLGKNPEKALEILEENREASEKLKEFITERVRPNDELVLFFAGLGGGTGTSTLVKAIDEFYDYHNKPKIVEELKKIQASTSSEDFKANLNKYKVLAFKKAQEKFVKIGVVVTLPVRSDGPDVLRQVNEFATRIWTTAKNPAKGIAFVIFADNQHFYDEWSRLGANSGSENYRDYANEQIFNVIHEINTATNGGGTSVTFDPRDFRRIILEGTGSLVIGKVERNIDEITNNHDLTEMFMESIQSSVLHSPIAIEERDEVGNVTYAKVHHVGMLAVIDKALDKTGSAFLDEAKNEIVEKLLLTGTVFTGYLEDRNDFKATVYTFYKAEALPSRLSKGLVKEYEEFMAKHKQASFRQETIQQIAATEEDLDIDLDLSELGIELAEDSHSHEPKDDEIDVENLDLSDIDLSKL
jgi:hypothetical protein